ncbi:hypothetical protein [Bordetella trematum]|uniref:hypothetical protein n=1 Tax=Bordetella trematum TaxID=123899 RepID=UPI000D807A54|nr:hypothetical protein [Bordetella trematum]SPU50793.1 Uncharacterised protein [Bordetella trematum]VDH07044.1 Uncharacterised protein [Bordetella trematum]
MRFAANRLCDLTLHAPAEVLNALRKQLYFDLQDDSVRVAAVKLRRPDEQGHAAMTLRLRYPAGEQSSVSALALRLGASAGRVQCVYHRATAQ